MTLENLRGMGITGRTLDIIGRVLIKDNATLDELATTLGRPLSTTFYAAQVVAIEMVGEKLEALAPKFCASAEIFHQDREDRITQALERLQILKGLRSINDDLANLTVERTRGFFLAVAG